MRRRQVWWEWSWSWHGRHKGPELLRGLHGVNVESRAHGLCHVQHEDQPCLDSRPVSKYSNTGGSTVFSFASFDFTFFFKTAFGAFSPHTLLGASIASLWTVKTNAPSSTTTEPGPSSVDCMSRLLFNFCRMCSFPLPNTEFPTNLLVLQVVPVYPPSILVPYEIARKIPDMKVLLSQS